MQSITMEIDLVLQNSLEREWHACVYMLLLTLNLMSEPKQTKMIEDSESHDIK
jgi:hypothetical protein